MKKLVCHRCAKNVRRRKTDLLNSKKKMTTQKLEHIFGLDKVRKLIRSRRSVKKFITLYLSVKKANLHKLNAESFWENWHSL